MHIEQSTQAIRIIGLELRTSNAEAAQTIPPHWDLAMSEGGLSRIAQTTADEIYAVYTHFENAGLSNDGLYSLIIGKPVTASASLPTGMTHAVIPAGWRAVFPGASGRPDRVVETWHEVWARSDLPKAYLADAERYGSDGRIDLLIGLRHAP